MELLQFMIPRVLSLVPIYGTPRYSLYTHYSNDSLYGRTCVTFTSYQSVPHMYADICVINRESCA
jgi:hypothetical protein